nr:uncharacterized protein LOC113826256 isoform X1 [Penaeus vannamei]
MLHAAAQPPPPQVQQTVTPEQEASSANQLLPIPPVATMSSCPHALITAPFMDKPPIPIPPQLQSDVTIQLFRQWCHAARCTTDVTRLQTERSVRGRGWGLPSQDTPGDGMDNACTAAREQHVKWRRALVTDRRLNALPAILGILSTSGIPSGTSLPDLVTGALLCTYRKDSHPERNL